MVDGNTEDEILRERFNLSTAAEWVINYATKNVVSTGQFEVTEEHICELHLIITSGTSIKPQGEYRTSEVKVGNHKPPTFKEVKGLMREFVLTLNQNWNDRSATQIAAYALWRLNWIHPFRNGNGRTSRLFSYLLMNMKIGYAPLPGKKGFLVHEKLEGADHGRYVDGLRKADERGDCSYLEMLVAELLTDQLANVERND